MKNLLILGCLGFLSTAFVCGATDVEWEWKTEAGSTTRCISVSLDGDQVGIVKIQWENGGEYEDAYVTTGTQISSICHEYPSTGKHSASMEVLSGEDQNGDSVANDLNYVGFLNQKVTNISKLESQTLDYFVIKENASDKLTNEQYNNIKENLSIPQAAEVRVEITSSSNNNSNSGNGTSSSSSGGSSSSSSSGGGSRSSYKTTETRTTTPAKRLTEIKKAIKNQETSTGTVNEIKKETKTNTPSKNTTIKTDKTPIILSNKYNEEVVNAYQWAYANDITSIEVLENARPESELLRGQMAKILVNYAVNVLGKEVTSIPSYCQRDDDEDWPTEEMKHYGKLACALGIMGINVTSFEPMRQVSRAQFGTALSRLLWGDIYNTSGETYYEKHLDALKDNGYVDKIDNPRERTEIRQRVWVMLERTANTY